MNAERIRNVFSDDQFVSELSKLEYAEEVQEALMEREIDFTVEDIFLLKDVLDQLNAGELCEDDLETVAEEDSLEGEIMLAARYINSCVDGAFGPLSYKW